MAVEPALQVGIEAITEEAPQDIEVTAGEPETAVDIEIKDDGSVEVVMGGDAEDVPDTGYNVNLAENMGEDELTSIADDLINSFNSDDDSRTEWKKTYEDGLNLLGLKIEERTEPWDGACGVYHPLLSEAVVRFQSEAITETFPAAGPV